MSIEAMKQALAKLEHLWEIGIDAEYKVELLPEIEALRQAIEQAEYDKLTVKFGERAKEYLEGAKKSWQSADKQEPMTTTESVCALLRQAHDVLSLASYPFKRPWIGLTDEEIEKIVDLNTSDDAGYDIFCDGRGVANAVMDKLKERNT
jgi:hypothetical protein